MSKKDESYVEITEEDMIVAKEIMTTFRVTSRFASRAFITLRNIQPYTVKSKGRYKSLMAPYEEIRTELESLLHRIAKHIKYSNDLIDYTQKGEFKK